MIPLLCSETHHATGPDHSDACECWCHDNDKMEQFWDAYEPESPNERCLNCGTEIYNNHYSCQGHQFCLPECPTCGGELAFIEEVIK